jgi:dipeptidyl aminopeptidase/acylaminoacyl peptidase
MSKRNANSLLLAVFIGLFSLGAPAPASATQPLSIDDVLSARQFAPLMPISLSPDGKWLAYTAQNHRRVTAPDVRAYAETGVPPWASGTDIVLVSIATGLTTNLTNGAGDNWQPAWSPDGRYLAFLSTRDGNSQARLWIWEAHKANLRKASEVNVRTTRIEWTPDSKRVLLTSLPEEPRTASLSGKKQSEPQVHDADLPTVILYHGEQGDHGLGRDSSSPWSLDIYRRDLTLIDIDRGSFHTLVRGKRIATYLMSPEGSNVAFTIPTHFEKAGSQQVLFDLTVVTIVNDQLRLIASDIRLDFDGSTVSWSPDGSHLAFRTWGPEEKTFDCYVTDLHGTDPKNVTRFAPGEVPTRTALPPLWDRQNHIYFLRDGGLWRSSENDDNAAEIASVENRRIIRLISAPANQLGMRNDGTSTLVITHDDLGKQDGFYEIDLKTGHTLKLREIGQCYTCSGVISPFAVTPDARIVYFAEDDREDEDIWISDSNFRNPQRLTRQNPALDAGAMGSARPIDWLSDDGKKLHGALLLPPDYNPGTLYPLVVWIYGGELLSDQLHTFGLAGMGPFNMQLFATRGYAVLLPDAPQDGTTPMAGLAKAVLPAVNRVVEMGIADPDRLGIIGHSYGGYSVLSLIVQSRRFKAAVEIDGLGDLLAAYGAMNKDGSAFETSVQESGQGSMGGSPWQARDKYIENSPLLYADRLVTPLLIIHGSDDVTVPPFLGDEIFVGLRRLGKEVEYAKYQGEGHSPLLWSRANQRDLCNRVIDWFNAHLK